MIVKEILPLDPILCTADTHLPELVQIMSQNNVFCVPVVESIIHKNPIGVVTERSICRRSIAEGVNPLKLSAGRVMNGNYKVVAPSMSLENCQLIMQSYNTHYLVVTDENNICRGVVTLDDVFRRTEKHKTFFTLNKIADFHQKFPSFDRIF